jgi:TolB protein
MRPIFARALAPILTLAGSAGIAHAQTPTRTVIEIGSPDFRPYPIAVPSARDMGGGTPTESAKEITDVLRWDLDVASIFKVLDPASYIADPKKEGLAAASIKFSDWTSVGAEGLIKVGVTASDQSLKADMRFYDVGTGRQLLQKNYTGKPEDARRFAHAFADELVFYLTGTKGFFRTKFLVAKKTKTGREIYAMDLDGSNLRAVTNNGSINLLPAWSRNGSACLFTSYIRHNPNLYLVPITGGNPKLLSGERGLNTGGVMAPDGRRIALTLSRDGNSEIYVMNGDGTNLVRLTNEWAIDSSPSWSPDGKRIAFVSSRWGDPQIFVMNADGSNVKRITDRGTYNQTPDWSPKGDVIAFTARDERNVFDIFTVNPETKEIRRLTQDQGNNEEPSFSPDGSHIVFTSTREGPQQVWVMAVDGSNQRRITKGGGFSTPTWSPYLE